MPVPARFSACLHHPGHALDWHTTSDPFGPHPPSPSSWPASDRSAHDREEKATCPLHVAAPLDTSDREEELQPLPHPTPRAMVLSPLLVTPTIVGQWTLLTHLTGEDSEAGRGDMMACHTAVRMKAAF